MSLKKKKNVYYTLSDYSRQILGKTIPPIPPTPPNSPVLFDTIATSPLEKPIDKNIATIKNIEEPYSKNVSKNIEEIPTVFSSPKRTSFKICTTM